MEFLMKTQGKQQGEILLTGASVFLAGDLLPRLLDAYRESNVYLLLRADSAQSLAERRQAIIERSGVGESERVIALPGDIEQPDLGLGSEYEKLAGQVKEVYHSAACTRFDQKIEQARLIN